LNRSWVLACTLAEAVGMTAAAGAARAAAAVSDRDVDGSIVAGLSLVVVAGLVEGSALGWLQAWALRGVLGPQGRRGWLLATVLVAGIGWAAASAPAAIAGDSAGQSPPLLMVLVAAAGLGTVMGALLGAAQAWAVRLHVLHPFQWVRASVLGWAAAMPVVFFGATAVGASWAWWLVALSGTATGAAAGWVLGVVTSPFVDALRPVGGQEKRSHERTAVA
jgi:hypothetical protein